MLQERDLELLRVAYEYRLVTTPQYLLLFSEESRDGIYRRLQRLFHHAYLARIGSNPNAPMLYAIDARGAAALDVPFRSDPGDRYIAHALMIGNFRLTLTVAARKRGIQVSWRSLSTEEPVRPDGFFGLRFPGLPEGRNQAFFFLEADRSTMATGRFMDKLTRYAIWHEGAGHTRAAGIRNFRVLTITKSDERVRTLLTAAGKASRLAAHLPRMWFASEERFTSASPESIFGTVWRTHGDQDTLASLVPSMSNRGNGTN